MTSSIQPPPESGQKQPPAKNGGGKPENKQPCTIHLGHNLQMVRRLLGLNQTRLAEKLGITQAQVSKLERSAYIPISELEAMANALGVTADYLKHFGRHERSLLRDARATARAQPNLVKLKQQLSHLETAIRQCRNEARTLSRMLKTEATKMRE